MNVLDQTGKRGLPKLATVGFFCTLATLVASLGWTVATRRTIAQNIDLLKKELSVLQRQSREFEALRDQSAADEEVVKRVFGFFRSADDIPALGGNRIVSNQIDQNSVTFYVPSGNHSLDIKTSWKPIITDQADSTTKSEAKTGSEKPGSEKLDSGEQTWSIPLIAEQGYRFNLTHSSRQEGTFGWELHSNTKDFSDTLSSLSPIRTSGASWGGLRIARFPNQPELRFVINPDHAGNPSRDFKHPIQIGRWTKSGWLGDRHIQVAFELTLSSENPPVVSASDAETLVILRRENLLKDYLGDGRYRLKID